MSNKDVATNFVLGAMTPKDRAHVNVERLYNRALDEDIIAAEAACYAVSQTSDAAQKASPDLWAKIKQSVISEQATLAPIPLEEFADGQWEPHSNGIEFKSLWNEGTILIRCQPGGFEDAHDNPADLDEHIIVIAGDLRIGGRTFEAGAYIRIPAGTRHPHMDSPSGCMLFTQYMG